MSLTPNSFALRCVNLKKTFPVYRSINLLHLFFASDVNFKETISALKDISFDVPKGKIVGILGKNGAGKSTLLRILAGVYLPTSGSVKVIGKVAGLFELGGFGNVHLTGRAYSENYLRMLGVKAHELPILIQDIHDFSELGEAFNHKIRTYSSGMAARLYFATATALEYEVYLIDELLAVGDEHFQTKCWNRMRQRLLNGASGVLVTHDWSAIIKLCENAHIIKNGVFSFSGPSNKTVVSYLNIPVPESNVARFLIDNKTIYRAETGEKAKIELGIEILQSVPVEVSISIETLRVGLGWEIVLITSGFYICDTIGHHKVEINIPDLPLSPGQYSFNLFLTQHNKNKLDAKKSLDIRSWTTGNGLTLQVDGTTKSTVVDMKYNVRKISW